MTLPPVGPTSPRIVEGERRVITILFCDVANSTALAGQLDPEEWAEVMNEAFQYMIAPIQEYEGMVARLMGDAILAFFGAPQAHEDDPQRAVLAGLSIVSGMRPFIKQFRDDYGLEFNVRVGINTGPVVVGEIGSTMMQEYTAMGDAINLAARMEQTALPGTVQISEDTYRLVAPLFDVWDLGGIEVKGKDEPVQAYRVLGVDPQPGRLRGIEGLETVLVGRDKEMARLRESLDGIAHGNGRIVFVLGEAGLGKSRLAAELRREWRARLAEIYGQAPPIWSGWTEFVAVSYGASRPYDMLKRQLRQYCGIRETDPPAVIHDRLNALVSLYPEDMHSRLHRFFGFLLGDTLPDDGALPEGEAFKRELRNVIVAAANFQASQGPIVYVMDDLHWADPASIETLRDLLSLVSSLPILYVLALRPDWNSPGWQLFVNSQLDYPEQCVAIFLEPLSRADGRILIGSLLGGSAVPPRVVDAIQQKAEGNPLFIEEVARALYENGMVARTGEETIWREDADEEEVLRLISLPGNVQALMTARIDRLAPDIRRTLQLASVIGRTFLQRVLVQLVGPDVDVAEQLQTLVGADLIRPTGSGEGEYTFLHALARDAAYETILIRQRRRYHRRVGEVIEATFPDRLEEEASRLAYHFAEARDWARAIHYFDLAGETAFKIYAHAEAIEHFGRAIEIAGDAPNAVADEELTRLFLRRGRIFELEGLFDEAIVNYETLEALGQQRGNPEMELASVAAQAIIYASPNFRMDIPRGTDRAQRTLALAEQLGNAEAEARAYWSLLLLGISTATDLDATVHYGEKALALARDHDLRELEAYILNDLGRCQAASGYLAAATVTFGRAAELWQQLGNDHLLADSLALSSQVALLDARTGDAVALAREGVALAQRIGSVRGEAHNSYALGYALLELGQLEEACELLDRSIDLARRANFQWPLETIPLVLAWAYGTLLGTHERQRAVLAAWLDTPGAKESSVSHALGHGLRLLADGQPDEAVAAIAGVAPLGEFLHDGPQQLYGALAALEILRAGGRFEQLLATATALQTALARLEVKAIAVQLQRYVAAARSGLGDSAGASDALQEALVLARAQGNRGQLWRVLAELAAAESDSELRAAYRADAIAEANDLASSINDPELYAAFLEQPELRALLARD